MRVRGSHCLKEQTQNKTSSQPRSPQFTGACSSSSYSMHWMCFLQKVCSSVATNPWAESWHFMLICSIICPWWRQLHPRASWRNSFWINACHSHTAGADLTLWLSLLICVTTSASRHYELRHPEPNSSLRWTCLDSHRVFLVTWSVNGNSLNEACRLYYSLMAQLLMRGPRKHNF